MGVIIATCRYLNNLKISLTSLCEKTLNKKEERKSKVLRTANDGEKDWFLTHLAAHTPSITFRHLPPDTGRFSYAIEGALFISAQLPTDAVSALRKVWVLK